MSDADNYAPGAYNDPSAPWNQPEPIEDTDAFQDRQLEIWNDRIMDATGYMLEGITERPDDDLRALARMVRDNQNGTYTEAIGAYISKWVTDYCQPSDDEVIDELQREPDERY